MSPSNLARIFSYAFTTAGRAADEDEDECGGGPYAAQHVGGIATIGAGGSPGEANIFGEITGKGLQAGLGTIAGLGYGLPMSRLYARLACCLLSSSLQSYVSQVLWGFIGPSISRRLGWVN